MLENSGDAEKVGEDFRGLLFAAEQTTSQNEALALMGFLAARRFDEPPGSHCMDHVRWSCMNTVHERSDSNARNAILEHALRSVGLPDDFQLPNPNTQSQGFDLYGRFKQGSDLAPLLESGRCLRESSKQACLSKIIPQKQPNIQNVNLVQERRQAASTPPRQSWAREQPRATNAPPKNNAWSGRKRRMLQHEVRIKPSGYSQHPKQSQSHARDEIDDPMDEDTPNNEGENDAFKGMSFQTAAAKLRADNAKKFGHSNALGGEGGGNKKRAPAAPRAGLSRRGGVRGGFVPPYLKKALEDTTDSKQQDGPLTPKTLQLLNGVDGELPEALQKFDPALIETVCSEVMEQGGTVEWDDIAGQETAKQLVQEMVVWPMMNPHLFQGARAPPKGLLLFGPPGTGKTLIGKAIASNIKATFFNISASSLTSKWIGEGEKMVRVLFAVAEHIQPSVIFIDEIDSILSARKSEGEHEASRRLKTELLVQMDGCNPSSATRRVLLVGATNRPEELDEAARRRMPKQLYIPLPCDAARKQMIARQLVCVRNSLPPADIDKIVLKTAGYSGADMKNLIQEACQGPVREAVHKMGAKVAGLSETDLRAVIIKDFQMAARAQKPSVSPDEVVRYEAYNSKHGARYVGELKEMSDDDW